MKLNSGCMVFKFKVKAVQNFLMILFQVGAVINLKFRELECTVHASHNSMALPTVVIEFNALAGK
jgi:hypothetical protein